MAEEVRRFGGTVMTIAGDQIAAVFGAPTAHEDDAERAVRAAVAIRDCALHDHLGRPLKVHVGINTGEVMAGLIGPVGRQAFAVMGDTTNVASRLMSAAPAGSVLVGEETWRGTRQSIRYRELPPILVKGKQQPVAVWEPLEVMAGPKSRPLGTAPLVGRDDELGLLSSTWFRVVREAKPHLATIVGDPGLGKTRLVAEFEKRFCADARVLHGRCLPYGEALGYWALTAALKEAAGITSEMEPAAARQELARLVKQVLMNEVEAEVDDIIRHLSLLSSLNIDQDSVGRRADQRILHNSVRRFMEALARQQPLCWMIEDIHWADEALLDLVEFVASRAKDAPLFILAQARPSLLEKRPNWGTGVRAFTSLPLETLSVRSGRELVVALCRERNLPESVADQIGQGAGGNPLFAEELVAMLAERGQDTGVPSAIKALIAARLDALPSTERRLLQVAAVFGKIFWAGGLRAIGSGESILDDLERLEQKDLLRSQTRSQFRGEREFAFKHDLIRDAAYEMLPRAERRNLHGQIADWLEKVASDRPESCLDQLAHHTLGAGQDQRALAFLTEAAERARNVAAHRQESALLLQATGIAEKLGKAALLGELCARRGIAFERVGMWSEARPELERALHHLPEQSEERRAEIHVILSSICLWLLDLPTARVHVARAIELGQRVGRQDLVGEAKGWLATINQAEGDLPTAINLFKEAVVEAQTRIGPVHVFPLCLYLVGRTEEAAAAAEKLIGRVVGNANTSSTMFGYPHIGLTMAAMGRYDQAFAAFTEARRFGFEYQIWPFLARSIAMSAGVHMDLYDYETNEALNEEAAEMARRNNFPPTVVSACIDQLLNLARRGEVSRASALLPSTEEVAAETGGWHGWLWSIRLSEAKAELSLAKQDWAGVHHWGEQTIVESRAKGRVKYEALGLWTRARALHARGRTNEAVLDLQNAIVLARRLRDPALVLRVASVLLQIDGNDALAREAAALIDQIRTALSVGPTRNRFESAEPICAIRKLVSINPVGPES
jgi:tetratricopeptide (TPR) repeat protein